MSILALSYRLPIADDLRQAIANIDWQGVVQYLYESKGRVNATFYANIVIIDKKSSWISGPNDVYVDEGGDLTKFKPDESRVSVYDPANREFLLVSPIPAEYEFDDVVNIINTLVEQEATRQGIPLKKRKDGVYFDLRRLDSDLWVCSLCLHGSNVKRSGLYFKNNIKTYSTTTIERGIIFPDGSLAVGPENHAEIIDREYDLEKVEHAYKVFYDEMDVYNYLMDEILSGGGLRFVFRGGKEVYIETYSYDNILNNLNVLEEYIVNGTMLSADNEISVIAEITAPSWTTSGPPTGVGFTTTVRHFKRDMVAKLRPTSGDATVEKERRKQYLDELWRRRETHSLSKHKRLIAYIKPKLHNKYGTQYMEPTKYLDSQSSLGLKQSYVHTDWSAVASDIATVAQSVVDRITAPSGSLELYMNVVYNKYRGSNVATVSVSVAADDSEYSITKLQSPSKKGLVDDVRNVRQMFVDALAGQVHDVQVDKKRISPSDLGTVNIRRIADISITPRE
jgi:hypothetical protein